MVGIHYVMRHSFVLRSEAFVNIAPYNRVHKEAACIACHLRIGELSLAYIDNGLTQLLSCRLTDALLLKRMANIAIVKIRTEVEREAISDVSNHIMVFPLVLEAALTISIAAVFVRELHHIAGSNLHSLNFRNQVLGFSAVCSDVLHRTCAHFARYKREILCSMPSFFYGISHDVVPCFARTAAQPHLTFAFFHYLAPHYCRMKHKSGEVAGEQKIASAADNQQRLVFGCYRTHASLQFIYVVELYKAAAIARYTECVMIEEIIVLYIFHHFSSFRTLHYKFHKLPLSADAAESKLSLDAIGYASDNKNLLSALRVFLSVQNVINHLMWQFRRERKPLLRCKYSAHRLEVVVRIRTGELQWVVHACHLKRSVVDELLIEMQERSILALGETLVANGSHHPQALLALEDILLHAISLQIDALHNNM